MAKGLEDRDYVENYTLGFEELKERASQYPPEKAAEITGVPAAEFASSREYATTQPSAIREGVAWTRQASPKWQLRGARMAVDV